MKTKAEKQQFVADVLRPCDKETLAKRWQQQCAKQGFSGEYALAIALGEKGYDEEQAEMVANLFGR